MIKQFYAYLAHPCTREEIIDIDQTIDVLAGILLALAGSYGVWRWKGHLMKHSVFGSGSCKERDERLW